MSPRRRATVSLTLTRQGVATLVAGAVAVVVGRVFAIVELFVFGAAFFAAAVVAVVMVWVRRPRIEASRWIHPSLLVAGDTGRVDLTLHHRSPLRSSAFVLEEPVRRTMTEDHIARLPVGSLPPSATSSSGYRVPASTRGVISVGPLRAVLNDPLGIARSSTVVADVDEIVVAPRTLPIDMPELGRGPLGNVLLESSRRLGPGDFHGLRDYAIGDEPRSIHWRASARADDLIVKEHTIEGLHQCTVVFDPSPTAHASSANFELGVTVAASVVHHALRAGLSTRFVTAGGIDLRGPDVATNTLRVLARIEPTPPDALAPLDPDMVDGLMLLVVVTGSERSPIWQAARTVSNPAMTRLLVTTDQATSGRLSIAARSTEEFVSNWQRLVGRTGRSGPPATADVQETP